MHECCVASRIRRFRTFRIVVVVVGLVPFVCVWICFVWRKMHLIVAKIQRVVQYVISVCRLVDGAFVHSIAGCSESFASFLVCSHNMILSIRFDSICRWHKGNRYNTLCTAFITIAVYSLVHTMPVCTVLSHLCDVSYQQQHAFNPSHSRSLNRRAKICALKAQHTLGLGENSLAMTLVENASVLCMPSGCRAFDVRPEREQERQRAHVLAYSFAYYDQCCDNASAQSNGNTPSRPNRCGFPAFDVLFSGISGGGDRERCRVCIESCAACSIH